MGLMRVGTQVAMRSAKICGGMMINMPTSSGSNSRFTRSPAYWPDVRKPSAK